MVENRTCPTCEGSLSEGTTTFTVDYEHGVLVVRHVPALVCTQCGESWIDDGTSEKLDEIAKDAKKRKSSVEVVDMAA